MGSGGSGQGRGGLVSCCCGQGSLTSASCWSLAVSLFGSETLWGRKMGTDQNQSGVKPRVWLATGRSAQLGADWHSPRETGAWGGELQETPGSPPSPCAGSAGSRGPGQGVALWGAPSPSRTPPAASARAPCALSATCLRTTSDCVF